MFTFSDFTHKIWDVPYETYGDKDVSSSQNKILGNCFVISTGNVSQDPLKHIYVFRYKLGCPVAHRLPKDSSSSDPLR